MKAEQSATFLFVTIYRRLSGVDLFGTSLALPIIQMRENGGVGRSTGTPSKHGSPKDYLFDRFDGEVAADGGIGKNRRTFHVSKTEDLSQFSQRINAAGKFVSGGAWGA